MNRKRTVNHGGHGENLELSTNASLPLWMAQAVRIGYCFSAVFAVHAVVKQSLPG